MKICTQCRNSFDDALDSCPNDTTRLIAIAAKGSDPMIGSVLANRFLITEKLGQGGMGAVYKAIHTHMDRTCAIKLLTSATKDSESATARFIREAKMASRIENPHAVAIYDFGEAEAGVLYLCMEYVEGRPLSEVLAQHAPLAADRVANITTQIAEGLAAAHALGIVHRDLKPDNVMITRRGADSDYVKVLDFGIAKTVAEGGADNLTKTGFVLGTPVYMSPEQLSGEPLGPGSDIYSLAIIVYEMLSAQLPFQGDNMQSVMIKRLTSSPIPLQAQAPHISEAVDQVVMRGLARDPKDRFGKIDAFASYLAAALRGSTQALSDRATIPIAGDVVARGTLAVSEERPASPGGGGADTAARRTAGPLGPAPQHTILAGQAPTGATNPGDANAANGTLVLASEQTDAGRSGERPAPAGGSAAGAPLSPGQSGGHPPPLAFVTKPGLEAQRVDGAGINQPGAGPLAQGNIPPPGLITNPERPAVSWPPADQYGVTKPVGGPQAGWPNAPAVNPQTPYGQAAAYGQSANVPQYGAASAGLSPTPGHIETKPRSSAGLVLAIVALVGLMALGGAGYFLFGGKKPLPEPGAAGGQQGQLGGTSGKSDTGGAGTPGGGGTSGVSPSDSNLAVAHYDSGRKHQEQADLLAKAGSKQESVAESQKAIQEYREAVALRPTFPKAHENLAVGLYNSGQLQAAVDEYKIAIKQYQETSEKPTAQVYTNLGLASFDLGRYPDAASAFGHAIEIDPKDADLFAHRGFALQNAGEVGPAKADYRMYLSLAPGGQYARAIKGILDGKLKPPEKTGNQ